MDKIEQLFVRACKSENPKVRLVSVLRRFYCGAVFELDNHTKHALITHLSDIVDKYCPLPLHKVFSALNNKCFGLHPDTRTLEDTTLDMLIGRIQSTRGSVFIGMSTPRWFKNN